MARQYNLLGSLEINDDGQSSELLNSPKGCALVVYLIVTHQTHPREFLADLFWEATSTAQALQNLRGLLARIRDLVPELQITRATVAFQPLPDTRVDFLTLQNILAKNPGQIESAYLDAALQCYRGDLLSNFYLEDAPRFEEWLVLERERLRQRVHGIYQGLCKTYLDSEQWGHGLALAQRWLALDPLEEEAIRAFMHFSASRGDPGTGLQQYETFRQHLWEEMGLEPENTTLSLASHLETLLKEQGQQTWGHVTIPIFPQADELPEPSPLPPNSILPYTRNPNFTGREAALLTLAESLFVQEATTPPIAAITGIGGLGKTQLAVEFAYRYGRYFPGGVYWMRFADGDNVPAEIAAIGGERGLGLFRDAEKLALADRVGRVQRAWQEPVPRLLIFDNCETEELLAQWRPVTGGCRVLITSRRGVWTHNLGVRPYGLKPLERSESVEMLKQMMGSLTPAEAEEIAHEIGDLPLALYLAGSFLRRYQQIDPAQYLAQLRQQGVLAHPSLQGHGATYSPTGHELNIARTFALNFAQLDVNDETDRKARELLACAIAFAHGEAIPQSLLLACVRTDPDDFMDELLVIDGLTRLLTLGVLRSAGEDGVQIHRVVAAYAFEQLGEWVREGQTAVENHVLHQLELEFAKTRFLGHLPLTTAHLQAITRTAMARADDRGTQLTLWLSRYLRDVGELTEARAILERAVPLRHTLFPDGDLILADLLNLLGTLVWGMGIVKDAWPFYEEAAAIRQRILGPNHTLTAQSIQNLGLLHSETGLLETARAYYEQAIAIYEHQEPPDEQQIALTANNLELLLRRMNRFAEALEQGKRSLEIRERLYPSNSPLIAQSLNNLGVNAYLRGDYVAALYYHERALQIRQESLGDQHSTTAVSILNVAMVKTKIGDFSEAERHYQKSLEIRQSQLPPNHPSIGTGLYFLGQYYYQMGNLKLAQNNLEAALEILAKNRPNSYETADAFVYLTFCHLQNGNLADARICLEKARLIQENNLPPDHFYTTYRLLGSGDLALAEGDLQTANQLYEHAKCVFGAVALPTHADWGMIQARLEKITRVGVIED